MPADFSSYDLYGTKITPTTPSQLLELLSSHIEADEQCVVASQNLHGLHVRLWDAASRQLHGLRKTYVHIDGMPIVALCRFNGIDASRKHRVTLNDFIWPLLDLAAKEGWRVCYVGSTTTTLAAATDKVRTRLPHLHLQTHSGYFRDQQESATVAREVAQFDPQLVLVGMGMGRQERWILQHMLTIYPACVVTVGACMEYIAGAAKTPPRWMGHAGCEWMFRLIENPSRFWHRYLVEPWFVLAYIFWYSSLPDTARLAGRIEELQHSSWDVREPERSESSRIVAQ